MKVAPFRCSLPGFSIVLSLAATGLLAGCGSGPGTPPPVSPSNTTVTLVLSSTANDQLSGFDMTLTGLTLTSQTGKTVSVFNSQQKAEFIHLNGGAEPLMAVSIPDDTYTAATATVGYAQFTCITLNPSGGIASNTFAYGQTPTNQVTVNLPAPLTISGTAMGLALNLDVAKSARMFDCAPSTPVTPYVIDPTFTLSAFNNSSTSGSGDGSVFGISGLVNSVTPGAATFTTIGANGEGWTVKANASTAFQGVPGFTELTAGMPVEMDGVVQTDGTVVASRIAVSDTNVSNLTVTSGPLLFVANSEPTLNAFGRLEQGSLYTPHNILGGLYFSFGNATFRIGGGLPNLQSLPFTASFTGTNMVAGQNVLLTSHVNQISQGPTYIPASTVTLLPQTINGTISAVSTEGDFDVYTVQLASYDLMPALAIQQGQTTLLTNPGVVKVYVDRSARLQNNTPLDTGNILRFSGLLFNDHGALKMDCAQVNDGVAE